MPRIVDRDQRRREVLDATCQVLAEGGLNALSFRAVAEILGGSATLVTHYFGSLTELLDDLAGWLVDDWENDMSEIEAGVQQPELRLLMLLDWLVPSSKAGENAERARIALLAGTGGEETSHIFDSWETRMRGLIRNHLEDLVPAKELDLRVDMIRVFTNGLTLSAIEHPDEWPRPRSLETLHKIVSDMGISLPEIPLGSRDEMQRVP